MSHHDPDHPYSEDVTRATPQVDPWSLNKPSTQPMEGDQGTAQMPYGSPPPYDAYHSDGYGQSYHPSAPYEGYYPYGQNDGYGYGSQYGQPSGSGPMPGGYNYPPQYSAGGMPDYSYAPPGGFVQPKPTNGMAIASLACGLGGFLCGFTSILAIIFGFMALSEARRHNDGAAKGMAIAGIALGFVLVALGIIYVVVVITMGVGAL